MFTDGQHGVMSTMLPFFGVSGISHGVRCDFFRKIVGGLKKTCYLCSVFRSLDFVLAEFGRFMQSKFVWQN